VKIEEGMFWSHSAPPRGYQLLTSFSVKGQLRRKDNGRQIVINKVTRRPMVIKSDEALDYEASFLSQVPGVAKGRWGSLTDSLALWVVAYYTSRKPDLSLELLLDLLQKSNVVDNDRYIREYHAWSFIDKDNPRIEVALYSIAPGRIPPFKL
jgi:hypothetical protein